MNRPLKDKRPFGPVLDFSDTETENNETLDEDPNNTDTSPEQVDSEPEHTNTEDNPILETAETWYENIAKEENKRKMMRNYFRSATNLSDEEIQEKLDEAGL
ncbi:MAG: hypothetical protein J07AB43_03010 [Candidatus Nanosalina sp. J07AB43]|nr:MAG: hypothetical protein J07AB43_03010 [Candidatus Nanosalina sp. J07AB43]